MAVLVCESTKSAANRNSKSTNATNIGVLWEVVKHICGKAAVPDGTRILETTATQRFRAGLSSFVSLRETGPCRFRQ
jgi:hypothetical protein